MRSFDSTQHHHCGSLAQRRALGSYPIGSGFKSLAIHHRPFRKPPRQVGQAWPASVAAPGVRPGYHRSSDAVGPCDGQGPCGEPAIHSTGNWWNWQTHVLQTHALIEHLGSTPKFPTNHGLLAKSADAGNLKSPGHCPSRFDSGGGHQECMPLWPGKDRALAS